VGGGVKCVAKCGVLAPIPGLWQSPPSCGIPGSALAVCRASRLNPQKIADQAIFYSANCVRSPSIVVFVARSDAKIYKCDRLLDLDHPIMSLCDHSRANGRRGSRTATAPRKRRQAVRKRNGIGGARRNGSSFSGRVAAEPPQSSVFFRRSRKKMRPSFSTVYDLA
jgi:hypothetical protein